MATPLFLSGLIVFLCFCLFSGLRLNVFLEPGERLYGPSSSTNEGQAGDRGWGVGGVCPGKASEGPVGYTFTLKCAATYLCACPASHLTCAPLSPSPPPVQILHFLCTKLKVQLQKSVCAERWLTTSSPLSKILSYSVDAPKISPLPLLLFFSPIVFIRWVMVICHLPPPNFFKTLPTSGQYLGLHPAVPPQKLQGGHS